MATVRHSNIESQFSERLSQWLTCKTTVLDVENGFEIGPPRTWWQRLLRMRRSGVGDDWLQEWERLKGAIREGDQLWKFSTPADTWENLHGCAGYAVVRDSRVLRYLIEVEN